MVGRSLPLRQRATVAFGLLAFVTSATVAAGSYAITRVTLVEQREATAERQAFLNARSARAGLVTGAEDPAEALSRVQTGRGGVALLNVGGEWFSSSVSAGSGDVPPSLVEALAEGSAGRQRVIGSAGPVVAVAVPIPAAEAAYVELVPLDEVQRTLQRVARGLTIAVVLAVAAASLAGRWLSMRLLRPVRRTAEAANEIREGALDRRLGSEEDADLQPLVASFNGMVDALQERVEREARFASDVTHELRSPLATMDAALSVARRRVTDQAAVDALDVLEREVGRFQRLIVDLLDIARSEAGVTELSLDEIEPEPLVLALLERTHRPDVPVTVEDGAGRARLDKRRIGQALANLLDNADNYGGGPTGVTVGGDATHVRFTVDDGGPGVPEHERTHVFERFARGSQSTAPGTGLGLALVAEHARIHGGTIALGDAPGGGARFVLELPRDPS